ncbi:MAG: LysR substrate-binding domain-containing protein, partial [Proteobacteria bacterium]|nr:LysR substrate-binding domain-containing protein [Pseudomonadota bacterium]
MAHRFFTATGTRNATAGTLKLLDSREVDVALVPFDSTPARFVSRPLWDDEFVVAARAGHPWLRAPTLDAYCRHEHLVVSTSGSLHGFYDDLLAPLRRTRRVAVAAPNYMLALALLAKSDLLAAVPRTLVDVHGAAAGVRAAPAPIAFPVQKVRATVPAAALGDPAFEWLLGAIERVAPKCTPGAA